ncbi:MAG: rubrerythrin family protein [Bacteroidetes bacterium]|nr:MAG: rubrerythrin family protein [Bacteroidota bacterium]
MERKNKPVPADLIAEVLRQQQNEINEHIVYQRLADLCEHEKNKQTLLKIAQEEKAHYEYWKSFTGKELRPQQKIIKKYIFLAKIFGLSFALRLMEKGEQEAADFYERISKYYPDALAIKEDEDAHEQRLIDILTDYRLLYAGAIVLGLNDALVEFTGTLAGLTFAFGNNKIIGITGLIMGFAASLSMAASGYLSSKEDEHTETSPLKSALYTGGAYIATVFFLVLPYLIFPNPYLSLFMMIVLTILIIAGYTFYISIAKNISFRTRFREMAFISIGVSIISFLIGYGIKIVFGVDVG